MPRLAVGHPQCGWVGEQGRGQVPGLAVGTGTAWPQMCQAPFCQGLNLGVTELFSGVMEAGLCLQMELLARPSGSGRGLG